MFFHLIEKLAQLKLEQLQNENKWRKIIIISNTNVKDYNKINNGRVKYVTVDLTKSSSDIIATYIDSDVDIEDATQAFYYNFIEFLEMDFKNHRLLLSNVSNDFN